jgi:hypothetical protein
VLVRRGHPEEMPFTKGHLAPGAASAVVDALLVAEDPAAIRSTRSGIRWPAYGVRMFWCTGSFENKLPSFSRAQGSIPTGTVATIHVTDVVASSYITLNLEKISHDLRYNNHLT